ncbi:H+transporting two-sector ATPase C subunit [Thiohalocapsa halophila]|uniref:H+transporting two-sector ATPase C subunit n=1 Tax=Thiohalocapsa halophila TaxID=69359 RepID=A0ABS1CFA4_9GAMM|nr:ATP synthase subunit C [Thiohalocapsa halophila]MBK1630574.1 H+transporting two-sector ATPase C subunit [Thiohalocapsa halophila]
MSKSVLVAGSLFVSAVLVAVLASVLLWQPQAFAQGEVVEIAERVMDPSVQRWGFVAAALATTVGALGAAYAVATVGAASVGALAEKPELFGKVIILVGLAEGIAIYGLIVSVLILNKI